ncbi:MAG: gamma-glutamyltransferase family protein [bacterium]|nr:gamma-glutamyltransferase family protein [Acidimicrobiia bacterium]MCY4651241.1 gamma-glutamyltransferase family protein [bacterium]
MYEHPIRWESRRSPVLSMGGAVASSQPLATMAGVTVLRGGGNAADAAVAAAAALAVVEPGSTGIGGDCFALFYRGADGAVEAVNGSGRSPAALTTERARGKAGFDPQGPHAVTVPGAIAGWADTVERLGRMPLEEVLAPAIALAEGGFPVTPIISRGWQRQEGLLKSRGPAGGDLLLGGRAPRAGEIWRNPPIAGVMRSVAEGGADAFYQGFPAQAIIEALDMHGGCMTMEDLRSHRSTFEAPVSSTYRDHTVYECPPNGQGITALMALNILEGYDISSERPRSVEALHPVIEAVRLAFADARAYIADPAHTQVPIEGMLSKRYASERRALISPHAAIELAAEGRLPGSSDTVYLCAVDAEGNACSFINSNYHGFGSGIVPRDCGFSLQNRGAGFALDPDHPNAMAGGKRPYHTIMPGMLTRPDGSLFAPFGVMGGWNQPQGHTQVVINLIDRQMDPQAAIDEPRFSIFADPPNGDIWVEDGIPTGTISGLAQLGHPVRPASGALRAGAVGQGQIIVRDPDNGVLWAGSDPRGDGCAIGL